LNNQPLFLITCYPYDAQACQIHHDQTSDHQKFGQCRGFARLESLACGLASANGDRASGKDLIFPERGEIGG
jgi:hypothetical protein